jgi:hypothetical protein
MQDYGGYYPAQLSGGMRARIALARALAQSGEVLLLDPVQPFRRIENPYLPGMPLEPGSPLFVGRQAIFRFLRSALSASAQSNVVVLFGERRIGKTSILKQLQVTLGEQFCPVFIDTQGLLVDTVPLFLYQLAYHTFKSLRSYGVVRDLPPVEEFARAPGLVYDQLAEAARDAQERKLLVIFDEFDDLQYKVSSGLLPLRVFDHLRHLMQHLPNCAFVLSGTHRIQDLAGDYWSFLFNLALHRRIRTLGEASAMDLIKQPMARAGAICEDLAAAKVCALTGGHPYLTQLACHMLIEQCNEEQRLVVEAEHVEEVGRELLRWGETHLKYWWDTASPAERAALAVAAESAEAAETLTAEGVARRLEAAGAVLDAAALHGALERLAEHDLLVPRGESSVFRLRTDLAGRWVRTRWPVERVACALREGQWADESTGKDRSR